MVIFHSYVSLPEGKISRQRQCPILQFAFKLCGQPNVDALWPQHPGCDIQDLYLPQLFGKEAS